MIRDCECRVGELQVDVSDGRCWGRCGRVVAEGVLGAQIVGHVLEREGEIGLLGDSVKLAAGVGCELHEGVFATSVAAGVSLTGIKTSE